MTRTMHAGHSPSKAAAGVSTAPHFGHSCAALITDRNADSLVRGLTGSNTDADGAPDDRGAAFTPLQHRNLLAPTENPWRLEHPTAKRRERRAPPRRNSRTGLSALRHFTHYNGRFADGLQGKSKWFSLSQPR